MNTLGIGLNYLAFAGKSSIYFKALPNKPSSSEGNGDGNSCGTLAELPDVSFPSEWITKDGHIECIALSKSDRLVAVADSMHGLHLFELESTENPKWLQIFSGTSSKRVIKLQFTSDGQCVSYLDKQGDIYVIPISADCSKKFNIKKIMGHTSFISDYVVRIQSKQIVSCDRDEKIRVSNFPDAFVIQGFKLGHTESVINVAFFESQDDNRVFLLSVSLTGLLILWNFDKPVNGTETDFMKKWNIKDLLADDLKQAEVKIMKATSNGANVHLSVLLSGSSKIHIFQISMPGLDLALVDELDTKSDNIVMEWSNYSQGQCTLIVYTPEVGTLSWWQPGENGSRCKNFSELSETTVADMKASLESLKPAVVPMKKRRTNFVDEVSSQVQAQSNKSTKS